MRPLESEAENLRLLDCVSFLGVAGGVGRRSLRFRVWEASCRRVWSHFEVLLRPGGKEERKLDRQK